MLLLLSDLDALEDEVRMGRGRRLPAAAEGEGVLDKSGVDAATLETSA